MPTTQITTQSIRGGEKDEMALCSQLFKLLLRLKKITPSCFLPIPNHCSDPDAGKD